jgi:exopolyphosphatase/guanosine-5'-triphosphate,3'-diphosphate pyrophosphatase
MPYSYRSRSFFILTLALLMPSLLVAQNPQDGCEKVRAAIDIGSGTTKMTIARVDTCYQKVLEVLAPEAGKKLEFPVRYEDNIHSSDEKLVFTDEVRKEGIEALQRFKKRAKQFGADQISAVATSAFRKVKANNPEFMAGFLSKIKKETSILVRIIDQKQEATIGFLGAYSARNEEKEDLLAWDIGGGSMQITWWDEDSKSTKSFLGKYANEDALDHVYHLQNRQRQNRQRSNLNLEKNSPNPVGSEVARRAVKEFVAQAKNKLPKELLDLIEVRDPQVIGIGGVHFYSNCEVTKRFTPEGCRFSLEDLISTINKTAELNDRELMEQGHASSSDFVRYRVIGALLTAGFMRQLGIEQVQTLQVNMSNGMLLNPEFW